MALTIYYLVSSFDSVLPWSYCRENWNNCLDASSNISNGAIISDNVSVSSSAELYFRFVELIFYSVIRNYYIISDLYQN